MQINHDECVKFFKMKWPGWLYPENKIHINIPLKEVMSFD